jgi:hypothetical protein
VARQHSLACALALTVTCGAIVATACAAPAQSLQRLTVDAFDLSADTAHPRVDATFHLIVRLHVRERVAAIENLELPILAQLELLGDERSVETNAAGTEYRETITVVCHNVGTIMIAPATLQAVDARDGHAKEYYTNGLTVQVASEPFQPLQQGANAAWALGWTARAALWIGGVVCAAALIALVFLRRPAARVAPVAVLSPPVPAPPSPRERLRDVLTVLRAERSRSAAVALRATVWRLIGASEGETLEDVLRRPLASDPRMAEVLRGLERAAFTHDGDLDAAVDAACDALERLR